MAAAVAPHRRSPAAALPLEIHLLAGMETAAIVAAAGLDPAGVADHAAGFFDGAGAPDAGPWVLFHALDPAGGLWAVTPPREAVARLPAYQGGPLEWLLGPAGPPPSSRAQPAAR